MELFNLINEIWQKFLNVFPPQYHALVASIVLIALLISFISLFMFNPLIFIIVLIIFLPVLYPILITFLTEVGKIIGILPKPPVTPTMP